MFISDLFVNILSEDTHMSDVIQARELINLAIKYPHEKQNYFDFLKNLRTKFGSEYSTSVHQQAAKLAKGSI